MSTIDWVILLLFIIGLIGIILWVLKNKKDNTSDYFLSGRSETWLAVGAAIFAANITLIALFLLVFGGCRKDDTMTGKYARPTWLAGKLYTQILTKPELSTFADLLHKSGYDTIIDKSGCYTIFAPSNDAFKKYFQENPNKYKSIADIPLAEAVKLVKYQLVQNQWSMLQLRTLDVYGWIDTLDLLNNIPRGNKRETLFLGINKKLGVGYSSYYMENSNLKRTNIIDTTQTSWHRRVFTDSRKYAPFFYKEYFDIYNLSTLDYAFYFGRPFENANDLFYCGSHIVSDEVFAENGFIYTIDRVVEPLKNGDEILSNKNNPISYSSYYNLVNLFSEMTYNLTETNNQPGANQGKTVDSLFNLTYPQLIFDINSELTKMPKGEYIASNHLTVRYHHGIVAPTNDALNQLVNKYLVGANNWGSLDAAPENIKRIIANSSLSTNPVYLSDIQKGFINGESDIIKIDESSIVQKQYGSNCTFIGVNQPIVPRAFSSVTGPVYTRRVFSKVMYAIEQSGLLSALKRKDENYSFFVESDQNTSIDSSLLYNPIKGSFSAATLYPGIQVTKLTVDDVRILLMNHIATDQPKGIARKEFIRNLTGNYLIFNNVSREVKGTAATTYGYQGSRNVNIIPRKISTNSDNGETYEIDNWFGFSANKVFSILTSNFPKFHALLVKAGYSMDQLGKYSFMSDNQDYTILAPSDSVLNTINTNAMSKKELQDFVLMHFIQGDLIFTDGRKPEGYYETCRIDASSTPYSIVYTRIRIVPGIDKITIPSKNNVPVTVVNESAKTNFIASRIFNPSIKSAYINASSNGVVHEIKNVLRYEDVDTK